jgi:hypothetical protein
MFIDTSELARRLTCADVETAVLRAAARRAGSSRGTGTVKRPPIALTPFITLVAVFAFLSTAQATPINLVVNGGFETGDFTGWSVGGNSEFVRSDHPHTGTFEAKLGNVLSAGFLSETLATIASTTYTLDFWLEADTVLGSPKNFFDASVNGIRVFDEVVTGRGPIVGHDYQEHSFGFVATGLTTLRFDSRNDQAFFRLDDVSVQEGAPLNTAVPEPATLSLMLVGAAGLAGAWRLRRRRDSDSKA